MAAGHLSFQLRRALGKARVRLAPSLGRVAAGALAMLGPAWLVATQTDRLIGAPMGSRVGVLAAAVAGVAVFIGVQAALHTAELAWLGAGAGHLFGRRGSSAIGVGDG